MCMHVCLHGPLCALQCTGVRVTLELHARMQQHGAVHVACRHASANYGHIRTQDPSHFFVMSDEALVALPRQGLGLGMVAEGLGRAQDSFRPGSGMLEARRTSRGSWGFNVQTYATMCAMLREKADELNRELLTRCVARSASPLASCRCVCWCFRSRGRAFGG